MSFEFITFCEFILFYLFKQKTNYLYLNFVLILLKIYFVSLKLINSLIERNLKCPKNRFRLKQKNKFAFITLFENGRK